MPFGGKIYRLERLGRKTQPINSGRYLSFGLCSEIEALPLLLSFCTSKLWILINGKAAILTRRTKKAGIWAIKETAGVI